MIAITVDNGTHLIIGLTPDNICQLRDTSQVSSDLLATALDSSAVSRISVVHGDSDAQILADLDAAYTQFVAGR